MFRASVVITEYIPASSETYPVIGDYYIVCIFLIAISLLQTTLILSLHFLPLGASPVPRIVRTVMFEYVGVVLGYRDNPFREKGPGSKYLKHKMNLARMRHAARKKILALSGRKRKITMTGIPATEEQTAEAAEDNDSLDVSGPLNDTQRRVFSLHKFNHNTRHSCNLTHEYTPYFKMNTGKCLFSRRVWTSPTWGVKILPFLIDLNELTDLIGF